jgi:hypothetical protein
VYVGAIISSVGAVVSVSAPGQTLLFRASFSGLDGPGAIQVPGLQVGDRLIQAVDGGGDVVSDTTSYFELAVSVADELQQVRVAHMSNETFDVVFIRGL